MPTTTKSAVDAAAAKKKKKVSSKDKDVKEKDKEKKTKVGSSSKDKTEKKDSKKKSSSSPTDTGIDQTKPPTAGSGDTTNAGASPPTALVAITQDPDAVQLFRKYDPMRTGFLTRRDFLQLLRDYAQPPHPSHLQHTNTRRFLFAPRQPLSLTDSNGIPLGYERSDKNSEFEAGQLFERYDKDHCGTLSLEKFHVFFHDFAPQLRAFVDDLSYASTHPAAVPEPPVVDHVAPLEKSQAVNPVAAETHQDPSATPNNLSPSKMPTSVRAEYQATLWELRKICNDELEQQRQLVIEEMRQLKEYLAAVSPSNGSSFRRSRDGTVSPANTRRERRWSPPWADGNQLEDRYEAAESDLERLDEILRTVRRQLRKGTEISVDDMRAFLSRAPELLSDAQELAMKENSGSTSRGGKRSHNDQTALPPRNHQSHESDPMRMNQRQQQSPHDRYNDQERTPKETTKVAPMPLPGTPSTPRSPSAEKRPTSELEKMLRVKDQMIYQLLQERTTLRREKAATESYLHELTEMSTQEMTKWAKLTDDMQAEIALLRKRLERGSEYQ